RARGSPPAGDDLAVLLQPERGRLPFLAWAERRCELAARAERRVERAVGLVAGEREDARAAAASRDDLAVRLEGERPGTRLRSEICLDLAADAEARVERAVRLVPREREGGRPDGALEAVAGDDDLPIGLERDGVAEVARAAERRRDPAARAERRIEHPVL